jgi:hypothetical protein
MSSRCEQLIVIVVAHKSACDKMIGNGSFVHSMSMRETNATISLDLSRSLGTLISSTLPLLEARLTQQVGTRNTQKDNDDDVELCLERTDRRHCSMLSPKTQEEHCHSMMSLKDTEHKRRETRKYRTRSAVGIVTRRRRARPTVT